MLIGMDVKPTVNITEMEEDGSVKNEIENSEEEWNTFV